MTSTHLLRTSYEHEGYSSTAVARSIYGFIYFYKAEDVYCCTRTSVSPPDAGHMPGSATPVVYTAAFIHQSRVRNILRKLYYVYTALETTAVSLVSFAGVIHTVRRLLTLAVKQQRS